MFILFSSNAGFFYGLFYGFYDFIILPGTVCWTRNKNIESV